MKAKAYHLIHSRFWIMALLVPVLIGSLFVATRSMASTPATVGYQDFPFSSGGDPNDPNTAPTSSKPQSKLWFTAGSWWGSLYNRTTGKFSIHQFDWASQTWHDTGVAVDERSNSHADCLWDGKNLYIATAGPSSSTSADAARILRYSFDPLTKQYSLDAGFPVTITNGGMEAVVLDKDSTGQLWVTYTRSNQVWVNRTSGDDHTWGTPFVPPVRGTSVSSDDLSAVVAFENKIGVMWSNQIDDAVYFAVHQDGDSDTLWQSSRTAIQGPKYADDHLNIKSLQADASGRVFAAVKTSLDDVTNPNPNAPQILLLVLNADDSWSNYVFGRISDSHTRPIVLIDDEHRVLYMFATSPAYLGGAIYYKQTSLDNIAFVPGLGTPFIKSSTDIRINNATSTKQSVNSRTGILVQASDIASGYYLHNTLDLSGTQPSPTPSPVVNPVSYFEQVMSDQPVSYWRLGDTGGTSAIDSAGSNNGTLQNGVTQGIPGALASDSNTAMAFNGTDGYVSIPDNASLDLTGDFSLEVWAKPGSLNSVGKAVLHKGSKTSNSTWQYRLSMTTSNRWRGTVFIGSNAYTVTDTGTPSPARWDHLVMTRSGTLLTLYVNGTSVATASASGALNTTIGILALARTGGASLDYFDGAIDEVALYNHALPAERILAHFNSAKTGAPPATLTASPTATSTLIPSALPTATLTPVDTATPFPSLTNTPVDTATPLPTPTSTALATATASPVDTATPTPTDTFTNTPTPAPSNTATSTPSSTVVPTQPAGGAYASEVLADQPVSYWRLGESSGTSAADSAAGNTGKLLGGVTLGSAGALASDTNTAMKFNGTDGYVSVANNANLNFSGDFALEAWANPAVLNGVGGAVLHKGGSSGYSVWQYRLSLTSTNRWRGTIFIGSNAYSVTSTSSPSASQWDYLVLTRSGSTLTLYVNGVSLASTSISGALNTSTGILAIGRTGSAAQDYYNGAVDEVAVYNHALSSDRILAHFNAAR